MNGFQCRLRQFNIETFFHFWVSREDTFRNKCGWQVELEDGVYKSDIVTFVTPLVKHTPQYWSKFLAMLDYTFWQTRKCAPKYVIIGAYDDTPERNGWLPLNTVNTVSINSESSPENGIITFDPWTGNIAESYVFYNRMKSWMNNDDLYHISDGILSDGIYRIKSVSGDYLKVNSDFLNNILHREKSTSKTFGKFVL